MQTGVLFLSLSGGGRGNSNVYVKGLPAMLERMSQLVGSIGFTKQCHLCPKLANFLLQLFQAALAWHTIGIYHSAISAFLEPHWIHKASNHPVISKLMHHFIYSILLPVNIFILGMLSVCYLFWKVWHQLLLSLPLC